MRPAGEPRLDLGGFVGGIVIHDDMDIEPFGDLSIDLFEEVQELGRPVTLVAFADDEPEFSVPARPWQTLGLQPRSGKIAEFIAFLTVAFLSNSTDVRSRHAPISRPADPLGCGVAPTPRASCRPPFNARPHEACQG